MFRKTALIFYEIALCVSWPFLWLYYFCRSRTDGKYRGNYPARMGLTAPSLPRAGARRVWLHALSVGEVLSAVALIRAIKAADPGIDIFVSTATETGMAVARERISDLAAGFFFIPHDFPVAMRNAVRRVAPSLFILVETDFWPNMLLELKRAGVVTVLANGRMSPGSFRKYRRLRGASGALFGLFDHVFAQTDLDLQRFVVLGCAPERVAAVGNLKFDSLQQRLPDRETARLRSEMGIAPDRRVWIAGSTHEGEEGILLGVHCLLRAELGEPLLIIAPRNIRRSAEIAALCGDFSLPVGVRSQGGKAAGNAVYLLDTLGELGKAYALADVAFLGGSLVPLGGHNPLEAVAQGKPACWGPHFYNFSEIESDLLLAGCGFRATSEAGLKGFLESVLKGTGPGENARRAAGQYSGSTAGSASQRIASILLEKSE